MKPVFIIVLCTKQHLLLRVSGNLGIKNKVHWVLDVLYGEDLSRKRAGNTTRKFSNLNRIALNLLKKDDAKVGIKSRRKMAGWGNDYILKLIRE